MRILVLGGTNFIGRAALDAALAAGHDVAISHRGVHAPDDLPDVPRILCDRADLAAHRSEVEAFGPEAVVDCLAMSRASAEGVLAALPDSALRWVVLSSMDVYRAFASVNQGRLTDAVPLTEASAVREDRYPYPDQMPDYSKLEVEDVVLAHGAVVLRLPMVYGPRDYQRREEPILRRVRAGRAQIPVGSGTALLPRGFVHDIAAGVVAAATTTGVEGEVFNLCEDPCLPAGLWAQAILAAAGHDAALVPVPEEHLPPDLGLLGSLPQPVVVSSAKARARLGYVDTPAAEALATSVAWHLAHPPAPEETGDDFSADDLALAAAAGEA